MVRTMEAILRFASVKKNAFLFHYLFNKLTAKIIQEG